MVVIRIASAVLLLAVIHDAGSQYFDFFPNLSFGLQDQPKPRNGPKRHRPATVIVRNSQQGRKSSFDENIDSINNPKNEKRKEENYLEREKPSTEQTALGVAERRDVPLSYFFNSGEDSRDIFRDTKTTRIKIDIVRDHTTTDLPARKSVSSRRRGKDEHDRSGSERDDDNSRTFRKEENIDTNRDVKSIFVEAPYGAPAYRPTTKAPKYGFPKDSDVSAINFPNRPSDVNRDRYPIYNFYDSDNKPYNSQRPSYTTLKPIINKRPTRPDESRPSDSRPFNRHTTPNPVYYRPGVKPTTLASGPPITNRPVAQRPAFTAKPVYRPNSGGDVLVFPEELDVIPELVIGIDEDYMSMTEKRRYIEMAERHCDIYKNLSTKHVVAIPLVPSPDPVHIDVSDCRLASVPLIVGGTALTIDQMPHSAAVGWKKIGAGGYSWKCGGSLVSDQFVLTAAHCAYQERDNSVSTGPPRVVQLGSTFLDDPGALVVKVSKSIRHPKYKLPKSYYDTALLKLVSKIAFSEVIKPACLGVPPSPGKPVMVSGWGRTEYGGDLSVNLRGASLPIWDLEECSRVLGTSRRLPDGPSSDSQICAGEKKGGKDTCQGDSGGPAQVQDGCAWRVVAVTSLGRSCGAPQTPGLYATVHRAHVAAIVFGGR